MMLGLCQKKIFIYICFFSKLIIEILMKMIVYLRIQNHILRILKQRLLKQSRNERATVSLFHLLNTSLIRPSAV